MTDSVVSAGERRVLEERARQLARPLSTEYHSSVGDDVLVFRRGSESFGIPLSAIVEVQRGRALTVLPGAREPVIGVMAWRSRILTVIDIGSGTRPADGSEWRVLVIGHSRAWVAILADSVDEARQLLPDECRPIDDAALASRAHAPIRGITPDALIVLDGEALLRQYAG